jgi:hypothetical protein
MWNANMPRTFSVAMQRERIIKRWTTDEHDRLRSLWALPLSTRLIALRMRRSKDTVMKKAREMGLPMKTSMPGAVKTAG